MINQKTINLKRYMNFMDMMRISKYDVFKTQYYAFADDNREILKVQEVFLCICEIKIKKLKGNHNTHV